MAVKRKRTRKIAKTALAAAGGLTGSGLELLAWQAGIKFLQDGAISGGIQLGTGTIVNFIAPDGSLGESYGQGMIGMSTARIAENVMWRNNLMQGFSVNGNRSDLMTAVETMAVEDLGMNGYNYKETVDGYFVEDEGIDSDYMD